MGRYAVPLAVTAAPIVKCSQYFPKDKPRDSDRPASVSASTFDLDTAIVVRENPVSFQLEILSAVMLCVVTR